MAYERLTQSLTQASYAKSYTSVLREDLDFFLSTQALREPYAKPLRDAVFYIGVLDCVYVYAKGIPGFLLDGSFFNRNIVIVFIQ